MGLNPSPLGRYSLYFPSWVEIVMGIGLYAFGALILTGLYTIAISVKKMPTAPAYRATRQT